MDFNVGYQRLPFFLRGSQKNVDQWMDELGLPHDAPRSEVAKKMGWANMTHMDELFTQAGIGPRMCENPADPSVCSLHESQVSDTMDSHRLAWYATSKGKGEDMWKALSRRYFEGKDTKIRPVRLDSRPMLMECAEECGLDLEEAKVVLESDKYRMEIKECVAQMHAVGINSIPVLVFEVEGVANDEWLRKPKCTGRYIHHGSGNKAEFTQILEMLHRQTSAAAA